MLTAKLYIGSRPNFDAWARLPLGQILGDAKVAEHVTGVWEGVTENTAIVTASFHTVRGVLRFAAWLATVSDNACVLATCDLAGQAWGPTRPAFTREWGARQLWLNPDSTDKNGNVPAGYTVRLNPDTNHIERYTFVSDPASPFIAVTVTPGGDVSPI